MTGLVYSNNAETLNEDAVHENAEYQTRTAQLWAYLGEWGILISFPAR